MSILPFIWFVSVLTALYIYYNSFQSTTAARWLLLMLFLGWASPIILLLYGLNILFRQAKLV